MSAKAPPEHPGVTLRVACHVHSKWSYDGKWSLPNIVQAFQRRRYRAVLMTEHDRGFSEERWAEYRQACAEASTPNLLIVPGIEYSDPENLVHILAWGPLPFLGENVPTGQLLPRVAEHGGLAVLAHPSRRNAWATFDPAWTPYLLGIEAWNRKTDGWAPSEPAARLLTATGLAAFAGLDFHSARQFFPLRMDLRVTSNPGETSMLEALRGRRCRGFALGCTLDGPELRRGVRVLRFAELGRRLLAGGVRVALRFPRARPPGS